MCTFSAVSTAGASGTGPPPPPPPMFCKSRCRRGSMVERDAGFSASLSNSHSRMRRARNIIPPRRLIKPVYSRLEAVTPSTSHFLIKELTFFRGQSRNLLAFPFGSSLVESHRELVCGWSLPVFLLRFSKKRVRLPFAFLRVRTLSSRPRVHFEFL